MKKHANFGILPSFFAVARKCHSRLQVGTLVTETALLKKIACTLLEFDTAIFGHAHYYFFIFNSVLNGGKGGGLIRQSGTIQQARRCRFRPGGTISRRVNFYAMTITSIPVT